jgi:hypothetical protein
MEWNPAEAWRIGGQAAPLFAALVSWAFLTFRELGELDEGRSLRWGRLLALVGCVPLVVVLGVIR